MGYVVPEFTIGNNKERVNNICERLDIFLASTKWCHIFPYAKVIHGSAAHSDHIPIIMQTKGNISKRKVHKPFMFEAMWIEENDCEKVIANSWNRITRQATWEM